MCTFPSRDLSIILDDVKAIYGRFNHGPPLGR